MQNLKCKRDLKRIADETDLNMIAQIRDEGMGSKGI